MSEEPSATPADPVVRYGPAGALLNARVRRLVYGADDPKAGAVTSLFSLGADDRLNHRFETTRGVDEAACRQRLQAFFQRLRANGEK